MCSSHRSQHEKTDQPEQWPEIPQMHRVGVDDVRPKKHRHVSQHVTNDEENEDDARKGDDDLLSDRRKKPRD